MSPMSPLNLGVDPTRTTQMDCWSLLMPTVFVGPCSQRLTSLWFCMLFWFYSLSYRVHVYMDGVWWGGVGQQRPLHCALHGCYAVTTSARHGCYAVTTSARHGCYAVTTSARHHFCTLRMLSCHHLCTLRMLSCHYLKNVTSMHPVRWKNVPNMAGNQIFRSKLAKFEVFFATPHVHEVQRQRAR